MQHATLKLYRDSTDTQLAASAAATDIAVAGSAVDFPDIAARVVRIELDQVGGTFYGASVASLAEVEVIARSAGIVGDDGLFADCFE